MSLNYYGIIILLAFLIPKIVLFLLPPVVRVHHKRHRQIEILDKISDLGLSLFGLVNIFNIGYEPINFTCEVIWIISITLLIFIHYSLYIRYIFKKHKEEYLYDKIIFYCPISITKSLTYLISGILLFNPYIIIFSIMYGICNYYLNYKKNFK